jgi:hypothetical protein
MSSLGSRSFHKAGLGKSRLFEAVAHGKRHFGMTKKDGKKDPIVKGMETLLNRSELKGIVDHDERSKSLGADLVKKISSLESATGKGAVEVLKMIGDRA